MQQLRSFMYKYYPKEAIQIYEACKDHWKATQMMKTCYIRNKKIT